MLSLFSRVENIVGRGENASYIQFFFFQKPSSHCHNSKWCDKRDYTYLNDIVFKALSATFLALSISDVSR